MMGSVSQGRSNGLRVSFGRQVRARRLSRGWSQQELARRSGLSRSHVSLLESGRKQAGLDTVEKIGRALECTPGELFKRQE